jgi:hypothetical protein
MRRSWTIALAVAFSATSLAQQPPPSTPRPDPNAALLYWRYWSLISDETTDRLRDAYSDEQCKDPAWVPDDELADLVIDHELAINGLLRAAAIPSCDFGEERELAYDAILPHLGRMRSGARLLAIDARRLAASGNADAAAARIVAILRGAVHVRAEGFMLSSLVACAMTQVAFGEARHLIESGKLGADARASLRHAAAAIDGDDPFGFKAALRNDAERAIATFSRGGFNLEPEHSAPSEPGSPREASVRVRVEPDVAAKARGAYHAAADAWDEPDAVEKLADVEKRAGEGEWGPVAMLSMPPLVKARRSQTVIKVQLDWVIEALAPLPTKEQK